MNLQLEFISSQDDRRRRKNRNLDNSAHQTLKLRRHIAADNDSDILIRIQAGLLQEAYGGEVLCAAQRRRSEHLAFEIAQRSHLRLGDQPEKVLLETLRNNLGGQIG